MTTEKATSQSTTCVCRQCLSEDVSADDAANSNVIERSFDDVGDGDQFGEQVPKV